MPTATRPAIARGLLPAGAGRSWPTRATAGLVLSTGLPGTGKSWLASRLQDELGFDRVSTDRVRKGLAGVPATDDASAPVDQGIYAPEWSDRTYAACLEQARELLLDGRRVVVDGTFHEAERRRRSWILAREVCVSAVLSSEHRGPGDRAPERWPTAPATPPTPTGAIHLALAERWEPYRGLTTPRAVGVVDSAARMAAACARRRRCCATPGCS